MSASWAKSYASLSLFENSNATSLAAAMSSPRVVSSLLALRFSIDISAPSRSHGALSVAGTLRGLPDWSAISLDESRAKKLYEDSLRAPEGECVARQSRNQRRSRVFTKKA